MRTRIKDLSRAELKDPKTQGVLSTFCVEAGKELGLPHQFRPQSFFRFWDHALKDGWGKVWASFADDEMSGLLMAKFWLDDFSGKWFGTEQHWYVAPRFRATPAGARLFRVFELEAVVRKCSRIDVNQPVQNPGLKNFYAKRGYSPAGVVFMKDQEIYG